MAFGSSMTASTDPFFRMGSYRQPGDIDWPSTPVVSMPGGYLDQNPDAAYARKLAQWGVGLGDTSRFANYLRTTGYGNSQTGFRAALAERPTLSYMEYLDTMGGLQRLYQQYRSQAAGQRGMRLPGSVRWIADI